MRLSDTKPTPMYSGSSDETGTSDEDGEGMGLLGGGDDSLLSLPEAKENY